VEPGSTGFLTARYLDFYTTAMATKAKAKQSEPKKVKTSLSLPSDLWTDARIEALKRGIDAQDLVAEALAAHLKKGGSK
jgi:hypothetical protein